MNQINLFLLSLFFVVSCAADGEEFIFTNQGGSFDAGVVDVDPIDLSIPDVTDVSNVVDASIELEDSSIEDVLDEDVSVDVPDVGVNTAPTAQILFPAPSSSIEASTVTIRGTANDAQGDVITHVRVNGIDALSQDNFATWQVDVPLKKGNNRLVLEVSDGSSSTRIESLIYRLGLRYTLNRNNGDNGLVLDSANDEIFVMSTVESTLLSTKGSRLMAIDLGTGRMRIISGEDDDGIIVGGGDEFILGEKMDIDLEARRAVLLNRRKQFIEVNIDQESSQLGFRSVLGAASDGNIEELVVSSNQIFTGEFRKLFGKNLISGILTEISSPNRGRGPQLLGCRDIALHNGKAFVNDVLRILEVDLANGNRRTVAVFRDSDNLEELPYVMARGMNIAEGRGFAGFEEFNPNLVEVGLMEFNVNNGRTTKISSGKLSNTSGPIFRRISDVIPDLQNNRVLVVDVPREGPSTTVTPRIMSVDLANGNRTLLVDNPTSGKGLGLGFPEAIVLDNDFVVILDQRRRLLLEINIDFNSPTFGLQVPLSGGFPTNLVGDGESFLTPQDFELDNDNNAYVVDSQRDAVVKVNLTNGARQVISNELVGAGPSFQEPLGITLQGERALVVDGGRDALFAVDLQSGERTILSNNNNSGPAFRRPEAIFVLDETRALVIDTLATNDANLMEVDLVTGNRLAIATDFGIEINDPKDLFVEDNQVYIADKTRKALVVVDVDNNQTRSLATIGEPRSMAFDRANRRIFIIDAESKGVAMYDLQSEQLIYLQPRLPKLSFLP